ncbi:MAG: hypothetical protein A3E78_08275 [Alphaproteobacteria bacterium RIFCSPHIGHO2_12_FULL_63_12]|nr:MAG: hypothetical protein A3E78_08275 [Alphaproteobacteria bacterium RIFCSPHIGHO2_12_FULL_63_12]
MKKAVSGAIALCVLLASSAAFAESTEEMCLRVSGEWGTQGDVASQCSCLADKAANDAALDGELRALGDNYANDQEAYDAASDGTKAAFDSCSVNS